MAYCVSITKAGSPSVLKIQDIDMPIPKEGEVCIEVHYAGINFADTLMRLGLYQPRPPFPFTPGYEVSGVILSLGSGVTGLEVGQRVVAAMPTGGQCSHVSVKESRVIPIPDSMGLDEAAAMPVTYLTAHHMLHYLGHLKKGETGIQSDFSTPKQAKFSGGRVIPPFESHPTQIFTQAGFVIVSRTIQAPNPTSGKQKKKSGNHQRRNCRFHAHILLEYPLMGKSFSD